MPKNPVSDPITDQEMAFAHLILSGTMTDYRAAEAVGLNPDTAAYTKAKPRVRNYMVEHRAAVEQKLVDQEAEGLRKLNISRDQILERLWELANLNPEMTRGSMAGQIKALAMIVAIQGLIPDRRRAPSQPQPAAPPVEPSFYVSQWRRQQQNQDESTEPGDAATAVEAQPGTPPPSASAPQATPTANQAPSPGPDKLPNPINPFIHPPKQSYVPEATGLTFDALLNSAGPRNLSFARQKDPFGRRR